MKRVPIGEVLKEYGYITEEQLQEALDAQKKDKSKRLGQHLIDLGFVNEEQTLRALSAKLDYPMIDLSTAPIEIDAVAKIPQQLAEKYNVIAIKIEPNMLTVVTSDPMDFYALEDIRLVTGMNLSIGLAVHEAIESAIEYHYSEIKAKSAAEIAKEAVLKRKSA